MTTSNAEIAGLNLELTPVEEFVFSGLQSRFLTVFRMPAIWVNSTDKTRALEKAFGDRSKVAYPYAFLNLGNVSASQDRNVAKANALRGRHAVLSTDQRRSFRVRYKAVDFQVNVEVHSDNYANLIRFSNEWMFARDLGHLKFEVAYGNLSFGISVIPDEQISFPTRDADASAGTHHELTTSLTIQGYISSPVLQEGQIADTIQVEGVLKDGENSPGTTLWRFRSTDNQT